MEQQLLLGSQLVPEATFANFFARDNAPLVDYLHQLVADSSDPYVYLWGEAGCGRSHLLQAVCHSAHERGITAAFYPLEKLSVFSPEVLEGMAQNAIVCIDDIDVIAGKPQWEEALFDCYNQLRESESRLIVTGNLPPKQVGFQLADLVSRLCWGVTFQVQTLSDDAIAKALPFAAKQRGFDLTESVVQFLLTHCVRDQGELFRILNTLDEASLVAKRKLTIPFVKQVLSL